MIITFAGKKRSGKDTAAKTLIDKGYEPLSFAQPLKEATAYMMNMSLKYFTHDNLKDTELIISRQIGQVELARLAYFLKNIGGMISVTQTYEMREKVLDKKFNSPREILQCVGTDLVRDCVSNTFWIDLMKFKLNKFQHIVITDARFENERDVMKDYKAKTVLIVRDNNDSGKKDAHSSENSLGNPEDYDIVIDNNGTLEELDREVLKLI